LNTPGKTFVSVAVPVFNNTESLEALNKRLLSVLESVSGSHEIVYVNDGSSDDSFAVLTRLQGSHAAVRAVDLDKNYGQSSAILAAMSVAHGDIVVTIDADLENRPEDIPALVDAIHDGAHLACGVRERRKTSLPRRAASWVANRLVGQALGINLRDWGCGLNAVRADITRQILAREPLPTLPKIEAALLAPRIAQVPVGFSDRRHGTSGYTVWRLLGFAIAFFRSYSISRTFRRLLTPTATGASGQKAGLLALPRTMIAFLSWTLLSGIAVLVRLCLFVTGSLSQAERFRIREIVG
jgi:undecaprenyl-phosphate 4-deoxy-4-formamido-L-arabinose transferase